MNRRIFTDKQVSRTGVPSVPGMENLRSILGGADSRQARTHRNSFLLHLRPRSTPASSTGFGYTFQLGFIIFLFFFIEVVTGLMLMLYYVPTPEGAYASILRLNSEVPFGELIRDLHRLGAEMIIVLLLLHILRVFLTSAYDGERRFTWFSGVWLLLLMMGLSFTGYLLPWDQLAYWAVTIGTSMAEAVPLAGHSLNRLLRGASDIGADGLLRFYVLHVGLLPGGCIVLMGVHYYRVARLHGVSQPLDRDGSDKPVRFLPNLMLQELLITVLVLLGLVLISLFFYDAPLSGQADPSHTPLEVEAPWFFLWLQGLLKIGSKTLMGVLVPGLFFLWLMLVPYLYTARSRPLRQRLTAVSIAVILLGTFATLTYMGTHNYGIRIPPAIRIAQEIVPEEGEGLIHTVPYDKLAVGIYKTDRFEAKEVSPPLTRVIQQLSTRIEQSPLSLKDAAGVMLVEEWQADLKRVTLRIRWLETESGKPKTLERSLFIHHSR